MRKAFSFTEVLFAVMILGIGFIMVAAMFPVAIHQTEASNRETIGASIGRAGASYLSQAAADQIYFQFPSQTTIGLTSPLLPTFIAAPTAVQLPSDASTLTLPGQVWSFYDSRDPYNVILPGGSPAASGTQVTHKLYLWQLIAKNMIQASDPRFAWVAMYKRDYVEQGAPLSTPTPQPADYAQIIMIGVQAQNKPAYDPVADAGSPNASPLRPTILNKCTVVIPTAAAPFATITFPSPSVTAENAYVVVSNDGLTGAYNGFIYRLGAAVNGSAMQYYFAPGQGPSATDTTLTGALLSVFVVGRGPDPTDPGALNVYSGAAQDVAAYTSYVQTP